MRFYRATRFLFPESLRMRMFAICFVGTHVPLLAFAAWQFGSGAADWEAVWVLLGATLIGTAFTLFAIDGMLAPVRMATNAVAALERDQLAALATVRGNDMLSDLLAGVDRATVATQARIATLDSAAHHDPLTGTWNRRGFLTQTAVAGAGAVAIVDIDWFKTINDLHGHDAGDQVLREFAGFLVRGVRRDDVVARWGGEEFVVYFPGIGEREAAEIIHRLTRRLGAGAIEGPDGMRVSFSAGVVDLDGDQIEAAVVRADAALYAAKRGGRDQVRVGFAHARVG
ncbi:GGDEF domain-containing protein [Sphingomonas sp.]|uniref:GGDEF domain-containing protein n=1 Tax=Sphingomonas sp. TaxID=28214 RepID=UPI001ECB272B|nr:GGDEF domain-containing protein [Sphingomonas sp.]MBX3595218.1 GGDEF domain-containing protein [Sphingomonas sp.]